MSDTHHENESYELLTNPESLEPTAIENRNRHDRSLSQPADAEARESHHLGLPGELSRPHRVRFRSISQHRDVDNTDTTEKVYSNSSDSSTRTLLNSAPRATDVTDMLKAEQFDDETDISSRYDGSGYTSANYPPSTPERISEDSTTRERTPNRSKSVKQRWREAGQLIRQKTVRLGERLGRPLDDGEALGASLLPEDLEGGMPIRRVHSQYRMPAGDDTDDEDRPNPSAEAHRLVRRMTQHTNLRHRKPKPAYQRSGQSTPERPSSWYDSYRPLSFSGGGGILSQLLKLQAAQNEKDGLSATDDSDNGSPMSSGATTPKSGSATPKSGAATPKKEKVNGTRNRTIDRLLP